VRLSSHDVPEVPQGQLTPTSGAIFLYVASACAQANSGELFNASQPETDCAWPPALAAIALQHAAAASQLAPPVASPPLGAGGTSVGVAVGVAVPLGVVAPLGNFTVMLGAGAPAVGAVVGAVT
jgi:hypothetical protein